MKIRVAVTISLTAILVLALSLPAFASTREHKCQVQFGPEQSEKYTNQAHGAIRDLLLVWDKNGLKSLSFFLTMYGSGELVIEDIMYVEGENDVKWKYSDRKQVPITLSHSDPQYREYLEEKLFIFGTGPVDWENGRIVFKLEADGIPFEAYWNLKKNEFYSPMHPEEECPEGDKPVDEVPDAEPQPPVTDKAPE